MNRLINYLNDIDMDDLSQRIIDGQLELDSIDKKVQEFNALSVERRFTYMARLTQRISRIKKPHHLLTVLLLVDHIYKCNPRMIMPQAIVSSLQYDHKKQKQAVILMNIICYYHYFLKCNIDNRFNIETVNPEEQFAEVENFCQISMYKIEEFLKICFVFQHGILQLKEHKLLIKSIVKSILVRFREDLKIVNIFIKNNLSIILQRTVKHPLVFRINKIYEKLIHVNKSISKLQNFNSIIQASIEFPKYEINVELNRQIEFAMRERKQEKENRNDSYICQSEKQIVHDCYVEEQRSIHTTESFLVAGQNDYLLL